MTHFRPICLMPLSVSNNAHNIVTVPPVRQKNTKRDILKIYKPTKTKFRKKLTSIHRRSAFCIFQTIKPLLNVGKLTKSKSLLATNVQNSTLHETSGTDESQVSVDTTESTTITNRSQKTSAKTVQNRKNFKNCDSSTAKMTRSNREKMLQEKEDFQLAKMLQECVGTGDSASRYSLRSRNKSSVSSLSSASSSQEYIHTKGYPLAVSKFKKTTPFNDVKDVMMTRQQRNNNAAANDKFMDFSFQKLTRSRRIAMTMSGI